MAFLVLALAGVGTHGLHALAGVPGGAGGTFVEDWLYCGLYAAAALACGRHALRHEDGGAWAPAAAGVAVWGSAELLFRLLEPSDRAWYPPESQALLAVGFALAYTTLTLLARARVRRFEWMLALDGVIVALSLAAIAAIPLFSGSPPSGDSAPPEAFLLGALAGLAFVVTIFGLSGWRLDPLWTLVTAAIVVNVLGDVALVQQVNAGDFQRGSIADTAFVASAMLLALSGFGASRAAPRLAAPARRVRLRLPLGFGLVAIAVLVAAGLGNISPLPVALAAAALAVTLARMGASLELLERSRREALTDGLTGLGNRRKLMLDLRKTLRERGSPLTLALFDLDGFKSYNDTFGHPSGDAMLVLLADRFAEAVAGGHAYRMGGDEFCALVEHGGDPRPALERARAALEQRGDGFSVTTSFGSVELPREAGDVASALRIADTRMYRQKASTRSVERREATNALLTALGERVPELEEQMRDAAELAAGLGRRLGLERAEIEVVERAAELSDVGKIAVPDAILEKGGPLDRDEWRVIHRHPLAGERILRAAPALAPVAPLVRSSHERWDGRGYPDGLRGEAIPIGARIVAVCDAWRAMRSERPYGTALSEQEALHELRRCARSQFDPAVVEAMLAELAGRRPVPLAQ